MPGVPAASGILSRMMLAFRAGLQFHGKRNLYEIFGYPRQLTETHLYGKYQRQDVVSRIVNMPPEEMWSLKPTLLPLNDVNTKWDALVATHQIWDRIIQADKLCSFGPFSVLILGLKGNPQRPAPKLESLDDLLYVQAYGGESVRIDEYEDNASDPRFGLPLTYSVRIGPDASSQFLSFHHSRVVHIVDRPLQGQILSEPRLAQVYNILDDLSKIAGGGAELFWIMGNRGMQVDVDKDMELSVDSADALSAELDEFHHGLRRFVRTRGVKINPLGSDVADPRGIFEVLMALLAATTSIPQRILMGSEVGQLASQQDRANWAEYIERRRTTFGGPYVLTPILRKLGDLNYFPADTWTKAEWEWPEAFHMNPVETSNALASTARAVANLSRRNQFANPIISDEEIRKMLELPEKPKAGDTMPMPPAPPTGGPASGPDGEKGVRSVTDAPSAIANAEFVGTRQFPEKFVIPLTINMGDTHVNVPEQPQPAVNVTNHVAPAAVSIPVTNNIAPAEVVNHVTTPEVRVTNNVQPADVNVPVNVTTPEVQLGDTIVHPPEMEFKMGDVHVSAQLTPIPGKKTSVTKVITATRNPHTGAIEGEISDQTGTKLIVATRDPKTGALKGEITDKPTSTPRT